MITFHTEPPAIPALPRRIQRLVQLAYNLWWVWNPEAQRLFSRIDNILWEKTYHNPIRLLQQVSRSRLKAMTQDVIT
jgi:starch phosphorylase